MSGNFGVGERGGGGGGLRERGEEESLKKSVIVWSAVVCNALDLESPCLHSLLCWGSEDQILLLHICVYT